MADDVPHYALPFRLGPDGSFATVEQGSIEEIEQCVANILRTIVGTWFDTPEFGVPDETFVQATPNPSAQVYIAAIEAQEPRARQLGRARLEEMTIEVVTIEAEEQRV